MAKKVKTHVASPGGSETNEIGASIGADDTKRSRPKSRVTPETAVRVGFYKGRLKVPDNFDSIGRKEIQAMFEGSG